MEGNGAGEDAYEIDEPRTCVEFIIQTGPPCAGLYEQQQLIQEHIMEILPATKLVVNCPPCLGRASGIDASGL